MKAWQGERRIKLSLSWKEYETIRYALDLLQDNVEGSSGASAHEKMARRLWDKLPPARSNAAK